MSRIVYLSPADHELTNLIVGWRVNYVNGSHPPQVELIASAQSDPMIRDGNLQVSTATTLAIRMDARVASDLYVRLAELGRSMGWLPQLPAAGRA